jgi:predicted amidohydrolase
LSKLLIGLYSYSSGLNYGQTAALLLDVLRKQVGRCRSELASLSDRRKGTVQAIFVAPEYLFTAPNTGYKRVAMSSAEKDVVELGLRSISKEYPNILMFPGTVFYQEEVVGEARGRMGTGLITNELELKRSYVKTFRPNEGLSTVQIAKVDLAKDLQDGKVVWDSLDKQKKNEFNFYWGRLNTWEQNNIKVHGLVDLAKGMQKADSAAQPLRRARNCCFMFLGGQRIGMYDKHSDFQETRGAKPEKLAFLPGTADQAPEVDGLRFGVEICFDHANAVLKGRGLGDLDFHVVVSDFVDTIDGNMTMKRGGYFLHAASNPVETQAVFRASNGSLTRQRLNPAAGANVLSFCTIDSPE